MRLANAVATNFLFFQQTRLIVPNHQIFLIFGLSSFLLIGKTYFNVSEKPSDFSVRGETSDLV